jgi:hypothetical protein
LKTHNKINKKKKIEKNEIKVNIFEIPFGMLGFIVVPTHLISGTSNNIVN